MQILHSHFWWPGLDGDIEGKTKACLGCQGVQSLPATAPLHPWSWPTEPWERIHIDFLGPLRGSMWLVVIDAHSKWPEVLRMNSTTTDATVACLRTLFARTGCPKVLVSDNGPQLVSSDFAAFLTANGIKHQRSAPFHPATNGLAERFVQSFKRAINAAPVSTPVQEVADKFLMVQTGPSSDHQ